MRRGRHTLGLSYCGRGRQFKCWRATRFVVVNIETATNNGVLKKAYDIPQRSKWGATEGQMHVALYLRRPDCVHAEVVRRRYGTANATTALPNPEHSRFRCLEPELGLSESEGYGSSTD